MSWFPALSIFFHLVFVISVHFDQVQVVLSFFCTKPPPSSHKPVEELRNPFSRKDVLVNNREGFNACDYFTWH